MALTPGINHEFYADEYNLAEIESFVRAGILSEDDGIRASQIRLAKLGGDLLDDTLDEVDNRVLVPIEEIQNTLEAIITRELNRVSGNITRRLTTINNRLSRIQTDIINAVEVDLVSQTAVLVRAFKELDGPILEAINDGETLLRNSFKSIEDSIQENQEANFFGLASLRKIIEDGINSVIEVVEELPGIISGNVTSLIITALLPIDASILSLFDKLSSITESLFEEGQDLLIKGLEFVAKEAGNSLLNFFGASIPEEEPDLIRRLTPILDALKGDPDLPNYVKELLDLNPEEPQVVQFLIGAVVAAFSIAPFTQALVSGPVAELTTHSMAFVTPNRPALGDAINLFWAETISLGDLTEWGRRAGMDTEHTVILANLARKRVTPTDNISLERRGLRLGSDVDAELKSEGWTNEEIGRLRQVTEALPGIQDRISFSVRDVYSPEITERFGQFEDFPERFADSVAELGLNRDNALLFWAAHWRLPSAQMGFAMLHRNIIERDDLVLLLKALDIMPFWRDNLIDLSFRVFTRVDIRRMNRIGVLSLEEVETAYRRLGYSPEDSIKQRQFVAVLNNPPAKLNKAKERDLTRADVLGAYQDGLVEPEEILALLKVLGYDENESLFLKERVDFRTLRQDRRDRINSIITNARAGNLSFEQAQDELQTLDLATTEFKIIQAKLERILAERPFHPSRADLEKFLEFGQISKDQYFEGLDRLGIPTRWHQPYFDTFLEKVGGLFDFLAAATEPS